MVYSNFEASGGASISPKSDLQTNLYTILTQ